MVMFPLTGQAVTPLSKAVLRKTQKLRPQDIIGSGGYGTVYKIVLDDLSAFAVKKMTKCGTDRDLGFERELQTLADVKHRNLVTLRGYYATPEINFLIYDLMPNGNLETILHGNNFSTDSYLLGVCNPALVSVVAIGASRRPKFICDFLRRLREPQQGTHRLGIAP